MSTLKELLKDVPLEWKALRDVTKSIKTGLNPRSNFVLNTDNAKNYYVTVKEITSGKISFSSKTDRIDDSALEVIQNRSNLEIDDVLFSGIGTIGKVAIVDIPTMNWNCSESVFLIKPIKELTNPKYLMYLLDSPISKNQYEGLAVGSTLRGVRMDTLKKIQIPIPFPNDPQKSLEIQQEIVRVLDSLSEQNKALTTALANEIENRKKQYSYYREELFRFEGKDVEWKTLGKVILKSYSGSTPKAGDPKYYQNGTIPWLRTQEVKFTDIEDTEIKINELALKETATKWIPENCLIIAISGATAGRSAINKIPLTTNQHCLCLEINPQAALYRYVFHWVSYNYENIKSLGQGARGDLNSRLIKNYKIPIPSLEEQERIVRLLD